jgi:hypothetical protein
MGYERHGQDKPKWEPVVIPSPAFQGVVEQRAYQNAVEDNPRLPSEDICEYLERINMVASETPMNPSREAGSDDE